MSTNNPGGFGERALGELSGTGLRNTHPEGVCLVVCEGADLPDRQSLNEFENVAPGDLLRDTEGLSLLAQAPPTGPLDGPPRHA